MHNAVPFYLAALLALAIIVIGCFYLIAPERMTGSFGLKPPASDADTRAWLRLKGIRDLASGLVVLAMMLTGDRRSVGIALVVFAIVPLGDMSIVLASGGSKSKAFSIHGVTCAVMLVVGLLLIHAI
jgi:ABC-type antimicrobial peptide transport system permease subunit